MEFFSSRPELRNKIIRTVASTHKRRPKYKIVEYGNRPLEENERDVITTLNRRMGFDEIVIMSNFQSKYKSLNPPTGYVATFDKDMQFRRDAFIGIQMYYGSSIAEVELESSRISDTQITNGHSNINKMIRDRSPLPPTHDMDQVGGWVESLGDSGRTGLYRFTAGNKIRHFIVVVAGLDMKTYDDMEEVMWKAQNDGKCMDDAFGPDGFMNIYEELAKQNRKRLLVATAECLGVKLVGAIKQTSTEYEIPPDVSHSESNEYSDDYVDDHRISKTFDPRDSTTARTVLNWFPYDIDIPQWYVAPTRRTNSDTTKSHNPEISGFGLGGFLSFAKKANPDKLELIINGKARMESEDKKLRGFKQFPRVVNPMLETVYNCVHKTGDTDYTFYCGSSPTTHSEKGFIVIDSPIDPITIMNCSELSSNSRSFGTYWNIEKSKDGYPGNSAFTFNDSAHHIMTDALNDVHTWEDPSISVNRNIWGSYDRSPYVDPSTLMKMSTKTRTGKTVVKMAIRSDSTTGVIYGNPDNTCVLYPLIVRHSMRDPDGHVKTVIDDKKSRMWGTGNEKYDFV